MSSSNRITFYFYSYESPKTLEHKDFIGNPMGNGVSLTDLPGQVICIQAVLKDSSTPTTNNGKQIYDIILYYSNDTAVAACGGPTFDPTPYTFVSLFSYSLLFLYFSSSKGFVCLYIKFIALIDVNILNSIRYTHK